MTLRVNDSGTNRKLDHEFLLVIYSNLCRITHCFRDTSCFNAGKHVFAYPTCIWPWIWRSCSGNLKMKFGIRKLE